MSERKRKRDGYFYLNVGVGADLKEELVRRAQKESLSLGNLVLRELAREFKVKDPVYGQNRVPRLRPVISCSCWSRRCSTGGWRLRRTGRARRSPRSRGACWPRL